jgi:hypothetical protein
MERGLVRGRAGCRTGRVELPRGRARRDPAHHGSDAGELLVTLAVSELVAAVSALVARTGVAPTSAVVATRCTDATAATSARAAGGIAIEDVARSSSAERGVVRLPPTGGDGARRAGVLACIHRAAEDGPAGSTIGGRPTADGGVRTTGTHDESKGMDRERGADDGGRHEEAATAGTSSDPHADVLDDALGQGSACAAHVLAVGASQTSCIRKAKQSWPPDPRQCGLSGVLVVT